MKTNCWEYKKCGREPGGNKETELGLCPATTVQRLDGIHGGMNGGRSCWVVSGTFCDEKGPHVTNTSLETCTGCDFYKLVKKEESPSFVFSGNLIKNMMG